MTYPSARLIRNKRLDRLRLYPEKREVATLGLTRSKSVFVIAPARSRWMERYKAERIGRFRTAISDSACFSDIVDLVSRFGQNQSAQHPA